MKNIATAILAAGLTSACSTTNFATPLVNLEHRLAGDSSRVCKPSTESRRIGTPSVDNARSLIENFILVYRCRSREAANGRQGFQLPAFVASVGAATASALGGGSDWGLAGLLGTSVANAGNAYYAPQRQAEIFDSSLDALLCIKTEAVGIDPITIREADAEATEGDESGGGEGDEEGSAVHTSPAAQYYDLVRTALFSVERVTAQRLRTVGSFDPAGVVAEITALNKQVEEPPVEPAKPVAGGDDPGDDESGGGAEDDSLATVRIELAKLQPKLQRCVVRAKI